MGSWVQSGTALTVAILGTLISSALGLYNSYRHLKNWTEPRSQRYVVRILLIAPVYAICSCVAVPLRENAVIVETVRDMFEAFIIYTFLALVLEYCGGDLNCVDSIKHDAPLRHPWPLCLLPPIRKDGRFLRLCKQGTLQFVFVKPVMGIIGLILFSKGKYYRTDYQITSLVIYNISYTLALYCLLLFYLATHKLLEKHNPVLKFLSIKAMVFATYWQGVAVRLSPGMSQEDATAWNNFILCVEMVFFSMLLLFAFGVEEYKRKNIEGLGVKNKDMWESFTDVVSVKDLIADAYHNFVPAYQDYVLQSGSEEGDEPVRYRAKTYLVGNLDEDKMKGTVQRDEDRADARAPLAAEEKNAQQSPLHVELV